MNHYHLVHGLHSDPDEDVELPRWILPRDRKNAPTQRTLYSRPQYRAISLSSTIKYYSQCLEAEGLPMEKMDDPSLLLSVIMSDNEQSKRYTLTRQITQLLKLACRRSIASSDVQEATRIADRTLALHYEPSVDSIYSSPDLALYARGLPCFRVLELLPGDDNQIQCTLELADFLSPPYDALSYVWGPKSSMKTILVNGAQVEIGMNLFSALKALPPRAHESTRRIWVDALCIDQQNDNEKSQQVAMMAKIYQNARSVLIYLGEQGENTGPLFNFLNRDHDVDVGVKPGDGLNSLPEIAGRCGIPVLDIAKGYIDLAFRPWFTRIWVAQEYGLANEAPIFYCSSCSTNTRFLYRDLYMLTMSVSDFVNPRLGDVNLRLIEDHEYHDLMSSLDQVQHIIRPNRLEGGDGWVPSIPSIEYQRMKRTSSDPRDIVYGMRELFEAPFRDAFVPDYTIAPEQVFTRLSAWLLVIDHWPNVLECFPKRLSPNLPSWVRDFTQWQQMESYHISRDIDNATKWTTCAIHEQVLYADCMELDEIADVFDIDEDNDHNAFEKLWHLDQRFTQQETAIHPSILAPLDTPDKSIASWAALTPDKDQTLSNLSPRWQLLHTVPDAIIKVHANEMIRLMQESAVPPVWRLVQQPMAQVFELLRIWAARNRVLSERFYSLGGLLAFVTSCSRSCDNLALAVVHDYPNLMSQLRRVHERFMANAEPEVSLARLELCGGIDANNSARSTETGGEWCYKYKIINFLEDEGGPLIVDVVLEIVDALRNETIEGRNVWDIPRKSTRQMEKERSRMIRIVTRITKSVMPSQIQAEVLRRSEDIEDSSDEEETIDYLNKAPLRKRDTRNTKIPTDDISETAPVLGFRESAELYMRRCLVSLKHNTFFITKGGLPGAGTPGSRDIRKGDKLLWLGSMRFPIVVRESGSLPGYYEIGGTVMVRGVTKDGLDGLGDAKPAYRRFKFV